MTAAREPVLLPSVRPCPGARLGSSRRLTALAVRLGMPMESPGHLRHPTPAVHHRRMPTCAPCVRRRPLLTSQERAAPTSPARRRGLSCSPCSGSRRHPAQLLIGVRQSWPRSCMAVPAAQHCRQAQLASSTVPAALPRQTRGLTEAGRSAAALQMLSAPAWAAGAAGRRTARRAVLARITLRSSRWPGTTMVGAAVWTMSCSLRVLPHHAARRWMLPQGCRTSQHQQKL
jgi:hypothetical protein